MHPSSHKRLKTLVQKRWFVLVGKPLLSRFSNRERQSGTKGVPFCPGSGNQDKRSFFSVFLFSILFLFQLYFCISIKLMYWNSMCKISTNIYLPICHGPWRSRKPPSVGKGGRKKGDIGVGAFCPGWSHDPGQKALLPRVVDSPGTKGPPFVPGESTTRDKRYFWADRENSQPAAHL